MNCSATRITVRAFGQGFPFPAFSVCTLRSNGLYIFLFTLPFVLFAFRRTWKKMFAVQVGILLLSLIITGPVYTACHVERASFTEPSPFLCSRCLVSFLTVDS